MRSCCASAVNVLTNVGLKGGATCRSSSAFQSVLLKKLCCLMFPFTPRRSSGSLTNSCSTNTPDVTNCTGLLQIVQQSLICVPALPFSINPHSDCVLTVKTNGFDWGLVEVVQTCLSLIKIYYSVGVHQHVEPQKSFQNFQLFPLISFFIE